MNHRSLPNFDRLENRGNEEQSQAKAGLDPRLILVLDLTRGDTPERSSDLLFSERESGRMLVRSLG